MNNNINTNNEPEIIDQDGISGGKKILFIIFLLLLLAPASIFIIFNFISPTTQTQVMYYDSVNGQYVPLADNSITINGNMQMAGESEEFQFLTKPKDEKEPRSIYKPKFSLSVADEGSYEKIYLQDWVRFDSDRLKLVWTADFVNKGTCDFILSISKGGYDFAKIDITLNIGYPKLTILGLSVIEGAQPANGTYEYSKEYTLKNEAGDIISTSSNKWELHGLTNATINLINNDQIEFVNNKIKYGSINAGEYKLQLKYDNEQQQASLYITLKISEFMKINSNFPTNPDGISGLRVTRDSSGNTIAGSTSSAPPEVLKRDNTPITSGVVWSIEPSNIVGLTCNPTTGVISWDTTFVEEHVEFNLKANCDGYYPAVYSSMIDYKKSSTIDGTDNITAYTQWNSQSYTQQPSAQSLQYRYLDDSYNDIPNTKWIIEVESTNNTDISNNIFISDSGLIIWNNKLIAGTYQLHVIARSNGYWSQKKDVVLEVNDSTDFDISGLTTGGITVKPNSGLAGKKPLPSNNLQYDSSTNTITLDYFHGHGGTISIPFTTLSPAPPPDTFELTSPSTSSNYAVLRDKGLSVETFDNRIEVTLGDEIVDNNEDEIDSLYDEILIKPNHYGYNKQFLMKLKINYHANWFEVYGANTSSIPSPSDNNYSLKPIVVRDQLPYFYDGTNSQNPSKRYRVKQPNGSYLENQVRTPNTHISNWYDLLDTYVGSLPDDFLINFSNGNIGSSVWYITSNVYMRFPNNIHTVGDNFMASYAELDVVYSGAGGGTHEHDLYVDIIFPESLLYAGDNFMISSFGGNYTTSHINFNDQFSMPKNLRVVGNDAFSSTFENLNIIDDILPPSFNLPEKLYKVGDEFCIRTFANSKITELPPSFNLPQYIIEYGSYAYSQMFASSSITKLPLLFTIPSISFSNNNPIFIDYFMYRTFYNSQLETLPTGFQLPQIYIDLYGIYRDLYLSSTYHLFVSTFYGTQLVRDSSQTDSTYEQFLIPTYFPSVSGRGDFQSFFPSSFPSSTPLPGSSVWIKRNF